MTRIVALLFFALILSLPVYGQGWTWARGSTGDNIQAWPVAADNFGNVFVAGGSAGAVSFGGNPLWAATIGSLCAVAKYDLFGNFLWARNTDNGTHTFPIGIATDNAGNCILLGWLNDSSINIGTFTLHNNLYPGAQYFIAKLDAAGNVTWAKNAGGRAGNELPQPVILNSADTARILGLGGITTDTNGNIYITTSFNLPSVTVGTYTLTNTDATGATDDILLAKYDPSGNVLWVASAGGSGSDEPCGLTITPSGAIYIAGTYNSDTVTFGPSFITDTSTGTQRWNAFIARYNASGNAIWATGSGGQGQVYAGGIASDAENNVYLDGGTADSNISFGRMNIPDPYPGSPVLYMVKFDPSNNADWYKTIGSPTGGGAWGYGITYAGGAGIWVAGAFTDEVNIDGNVLHSPPVSANPVFIAGFDTLGYYTGAAALQSGSATQVGISSNGNCYMYVCAGYTNPSNPFVAGNDVLPEVPANDEWLYVAQYSSLCGGGGGGGGSLPDTIYNQQDTTICQEDNIMLKAPKGYALYHWNNGSTDTAITATTAGTYSVLALGDNPAASINTYTVNYSDTLCNCNAFIPDAFTPNSDGRNDKFSPRFENGCYITEYAFSVYNRWGQRVFYTEDPYAQWDGTFQGLPADMDVYMFYLSYKPRAGYPTHVKKGDVTLIR